MKTEHALWWAEVAWVRWGFTRELVDWSWTWGPY